MIQSLVDLRLGNKDVDGVFQWSFRSIVQSVVGKQKLSQFFCKCLYGSPGYLLKFFKENRLGVNSLDLYNREIQTRIITVIEYIKDQQEETVLHDDERLEDARVLGIDMQRKSGIVDIKIELLSKSGALQTVEL